MCSSLWPYVVGTIIAYLSTRTFYRLFLHPLAKFPGPKLAAITRLYEAYYDVIQDGQYTFKIQQLHKKYGPIVRISPYELHVIDPAFFEKLYRQDGRWDKYAWACDAFTAYGAPITTPDHHIHKARRAPLNTFFSKASVSKRQDLIRHNVERLCARVTQSASSQKAINLGAAVSAFTRDVSNDFILGKTYNSLEKDDFDVGMTNVFQSSGGIWRTTKHVRFFGPTMKALPIDWVLKIADEGTKSFFHFLKDITRDTEVLMSAADSKTSTATGKDDTSRTIVHEIMTSNLPPAEKTFPRVFDDVSTTTGAGFETAAIVLRSILYHTFTSQSILQRVRTELASIQSTTVDSSGPDTENVQLKALEQLPYLTSIIMEGLRLNPGVATRMARIAPDRDLFYDQWCIPAGTPVGMTTLLMHTDEKLYPDPVRFNPDRWMDLEARKTAEKTYAPFSRGTRMCLGMHLAWAEMYLLLAALVDNFDFQFENTSAEDFECESDQFILGTKGKGVLNAVVTSRQR